MAKDGKNEYTIGKETFSSTSGAGKLATNELEHFLSPYAN